uniref:Uncharacterized protein n=1 Tax=Cacopsylla melanoneura TaxID=428564 RepID=A0A8D9DQS4_9HEMI
MPPFNFSHIKVTAFLHITACTRFLLSRDQVVVQVTKYSLPYEMSKDKIRLIQNKDYSNFRTLRFELFVKIKLIYLQKIKIQKKLSSENRHSRSIFQLISDKIFSTHYKRRFF